MNEHEDQSQRHVHPPSGRRSFIFATLGGAVAAVAGWIAGAFSGDSSAQQMASPTSSRVVCVNRKRAHLIIENATTLGIESR